MSDDTASTDAEATNFTWVLTNGDEAASGLQSGRYAAVVTIPPSFSAAATSIGGPATAARQAVIEVTTTPASAFLDPALTDVITAVATASLNQQLISQYLGNVYAGFNTINEQIGQASDGAASLASGAASVSSGADQLASGAEQLAGGLGSLDSGADALASGLGQLDEAAQALPGAAATLAQGSAEVAAGVDTLASGVDGATQQFAGVVAEICQTTGPVCDRATAALTRLQDVDAQFGTLASGADGVAAGNAQLAAALPEVVTGIDDSAVGATEVAAGADQANTGAGSLSSGAQSLADGAAQVDDGAAQLAAGLSQAVEQIPTYTDEDITMLSSVVSQPVLADQSAITPGFQSVPLFAVIALWFGGLVIALARPAVPRRLLLTAASSRSIALRSAGVSAALGAGQGLVVAVTLLFGVSIGPAQWLGFAGASVLVGAVFALVNQGLAAALGAVGRLLALLVGLVALAAGISSTVPPAIDTIAAAMPTTPARRPPARDPHRCRRDGAGGGRSAAPGRRPGLRARVRGGRLPPSRATGCDRSTPPTRSSRGAGGLRPTVHRSDSPDEVDPGARPLAAATLPLIAGGFRRPGVMRYVRIPDRTIVQETQQRSTPALPSLLRNARTTEFA